MIAEANDRDVEGDLFLHDIWQGMGYQWHTLLHDQGGRRQSKGLVRNPSAKTKKSGKLKTSPAVPKSVDGEWQEQVNYAGNEKLGKGRQNGRFQKKGLSCARKS
ncbi:hypothetical protein BC830DRAFT_1083163 [Chytriomyces sp. MP71]|nr:hypothetical protein BC830DRAFT_1083163 [Chytriomyces sp. MP71]